MPTHLVIVITFEFAISILGLFIVSFPLYKKYHERKSQVTLMVFLGSTFHLIAGIVSGVGRLLRYTGAWEVRPGMNLELLAFTVALIAWGDAFFFAFTLEVFRGGVKHGNNKLFLAIFVIVVMIFNVYDFATGLFIVDLPMEVWLFLIAIACFACLYLTVIAWKASKKFEGPIDRLCSKFIAIGSLLLIISFMFFSVETLISSTQFEGITQYTPYYFIGWGLILIATLLLSMGYIQPDWLKKRLQSK